MKTKCKFQINDSKKRKLKVRFRNQIWMKNLMIQKIQDKILSERVIERMNELLCQRYEEKYQNKVLKRKWLRQNK
jgi:hypothetical protein